MSVRGYKVTKFEYQKTSSFNLWHDDELIDLLDSYCELSEQLNMDGVGTVEMTVAELKKVIAKAKEKKLDTDRIEQLEQDIAGLDDQDWVKYACF